MTLTYSSARLGAREILMDRRTFGMWLTFPAGYTPHDVAHMA